MEEIGWKMVDGKWKMENEDLSGKALVETDGRWG